MPRPLAASLLVAWIAMLAGATWFTTADRAGSQTADGPEYAPNGDLLVPKGFENWVFVGSNVGLVYDEELPLTTSLEGERALQQVFHNIYINPEAYEHFVANREFPDPTVLVMDMYVAEDKDTTSGVLSQGMFNGTHAGLQVAVKNTKRPDNSAAPWAYYIFTDRENPSVPPTILPQAGAFPNPACFNCHLEHASHDNVWVQFYPILRKLLE